MGIPSTIAWTSVIAGVNMVIHVALDSIDWGANLFLRNKLEGKRILMEGKTDEEMTEEMDRSPSKNGYFFKKYYENKLIVAFEILCFISMLILVLIAWNEIGILTKDMGS